MNNIKPKFILIDKFTPTSKAVEFLCDFCDSMFTWCDLRSPTYCPNCGVKCAE